MSYTEPKQLIISTDFASSKDLIFLSILYKANSFNSNRTIVFGFSFIRYG